MFKNTNSYVYQAFDKDKADSNFLSLNFLYFNPEKRFYTVAQMPTTEAAILNGVLRDLYVVIGDAQSGGGYTMRVYIKPFANWIWGGAMLMALGGFLSLTDRRLRMAAGAAKPKVKAAKPVNA